MTALVVSVLYQGTAIPVAWQLLAGAGEGRWMDLYIEPLKKLKKAVPEGLRVLLLADRGLWSPRLFTELKDLQWVPLLRIQSSAAFRVAGEKEKPRVIEESLAVVGKSIVCRGFLGGDHHRKLPVTLVTIWPEEQKEPWILVTSLPPEDVGTGWYAVRMWIELGFRNLKSFGWKWERVRRTDLDRESRHFLVFRCSDTLVGAHRGAPLGVSRNRASCSMKRLTGAPRCAPTTPGSAEFSRLPTPLPGERGGWP